MTRLSPLRPICTSIFLKVSPVPKLNTPRAAVRENRGQIGPPLSEHATSRLAVLDATVAHTRLHAPWPHSANVMPTTPDAVAEASWTPAIAPNLNFRWSSARG